MSELTDDRLTRIREKVVLAIAFLGRDAGTDRMDTTLPQVIDGLVEADAALLGLLALRAAASTSTVAGKWQKDGAEITPLVIQNG